MIEGRYGVALTFTVPVIKASSSDFALSADWTPATGDVKISKDGAAFANITTLPTALGNQWSFTLSATEQEAAVVNIQVVDSATKAVEDQAIIVNNLPHGAIVSGKLQAGSTTTAQLASATDFGVDNRINGAVLEFHGGTGKGQSAGILSWVHSTDTATLDRTLTTAVDSATYYTLWPAPAAPTNASAYPPVNVKAIDDGATEAANLKSAFASTLAEVLSVPAANASLWTKINWLFAKSRNKMTQTSTTQTLRNDADSASIATSTVSDDGTTFTRGEFS